jgi:hypothetical protein
MTRGQLATGKHEGVVASEIPEILAYVPSNAEDTGEWWAERMTLRQQLRDSRHAATMEYLTVAAYTTPRSMTALTRIVDTAVSMLRGK